jgi:hypothetical protein
MDGLLNYLIPLWRDSMSSSPASAVSSVGFAELRSDGDFKVLRKAKLWSILGWLRRAQIGWRFQSASQSKIVVDPRLPFATRTTSQSAPKVYASKFISTY